MGSTVEIADVLMIGRNGETLVGQPLLEKARVIAEVLEHGRDRKIVVFKYKAKTRYRRKQGHRQSFTRLAIRRILAGDEPPEEAPAKKPKRAARAKAKAPPVKATADAKPKRPSRAKKATEAPKAKPAAGPAEDRPKRSRKKAESE